MNHTGLQRLNQAEFCRFRRNPGEGFHGVPNIRLLRYGASLLPFVLSWAAGELITVDGSPKS